MSGFGTVDLYTRHPPEIDPFVLCCALQKINAPDPIDRVVWRRYTRRDQQRLRHLGDRAETESVVWEELFEIADTTRSIFHKKVPLNLAPDLVRGEPCWTFTFFGYPFGDRLPSEWRAVPEAIRGGANDAGCSLTIGPHIQSVVRRDQSDLAIVRVLEASFSMHFSGYPASMDSMDAMKSLPTLQDVRKHLEPVLGPLDIEATWSF